MTAFIALLKSLLKQRWVRFGLVGVAATLTYYLLGLFFVSLLTLPLLLGNALAYAISFIVSYWGQSQWTFAAHQPHAVMLPKFATAQGIGLIINSTIIELLTHLAVPYSVAMLAAIGVVPICTYIICKFWVFGQKDNH